MSNKLVQVRNVGDTLWLTLPGNTGDINRSRAVVDESTFENDTVANLVTLKSWTASANAMLRGVAGYKATIKRAGTPTLVTGVELDNEVNGGFYTSNRAQSLWDVQAGVTIYDDSVEVSPEDISYIDYLQGGVVFNSSYSVTGNITADFSYRGTSRICFFTSFDIGQTMGTEDVTDFCSPQDNGGWAIFAPQQKEVDLSLDGFYSDSSNFLEDIEEDDYVIIEFDLTGDGTTVARGYFYASELSGSGDVASTETSSASYVLASPPGVSRSFSYYIAEDSLLPAAAKVCLEAWQNRSVIEFRYKPEGTELADEGEVYVTDISLSNSVSDMNTMSLSFQGTDALVRS